MKHACPVKSKGPFFMDSSSFEQLLDRAASWYGIDAGFWDIFGTRHTTSVAVKQSILRALGVDADSEQGLRESLGALERLEWARLLPPAVVVVEGSSIELSLHVPAEDSDDVARFVVTSEAGVRQQFAQALVDLPVAEADRQRV